MAIGISIFVGFIVSFALNLYFRREGAPSDFYVIAIVAVLVYAVIRIIGAIL